MRIPDFLPIFDKATMSPYPNYIPMNTTEEMKTKLINMAKAKGPQTAVNHLHHQLWVMEQECFDTPEGYRPEVWKQLNEMRLFSRELWDLNLA
jgi:hypothetical protein